MENTEPKEQIRLLLRKAFASIRHDRNMDPPSHEECVELREDLCLMVIEDLPYYLSYVLEDLLDFHTNDPIWQENANLVIGQLNVQNYHPLKTHEELINIYGEEYEEYEHYSAQRKQESYQYFSREQAYAILQWLLYAKTWKDFAWDDEQDDIEGALKYWNERVNSSYAAKRGTTGMAPKSLSE